MVLWENDYFPPSNLLRVFIDFHQIMPPSRFTCRNFEKKYYNQYYPSTSVQYLQFQSSSRCLFFSFKAGLYRIWCGLHTLGDRHSAIVNPAGQLSLTRLNGGQIKLQSNVLILSTFRQTMFRGSIMFAVCYVYVLTMDKIKFGLCHLIQPYLHWYMDVLSDTSRWWFNCV